MNHPFAVASVWDQVADHYTADLLQIFSAFASDALELAAPRPDAVVLDVAAGPGTLALLAAPRVTRVIAVDFSREMLDRLERRAKVAGIGNVEAREADGQQLPFPHATFDAGFSMFGLIFFPDRAAGFSELRRVLKPGGRAVVASWAPLDQVPALASIFTEIGERVPELPFGNSGAPLAEVSGFRDEMRDSGFDEVQIHTVEHGFDVPSAEHFWEVQQRSSVAMRHLRQAMPSAEWMDLGDAVVARLKREFGKGPFNVTWTARLGTGVAEAPR